MPRPPPLTHFICIPLASPQLARSLASFRSDVTSPNGLALPSSAVRPLGTMHLTLGVMALPDESSLSLARDILKQMRLSDHLRSAREGESASAQQEPLRITLKGLRAMQDPAKTSVLYAPPDDDGQGALYRFCKSVRAEFERVGLVVEEKGRPLLLHATVVNTIYVPGQRGARGKRDKLLLDARALLDSYHGYVWMEEVEVEKITLCKMGAKKVDGRDDEEYEVVEEARF